MSPTSLFRSAAALFVIFALGHTLGFLRFVPPTAEGVAVRDAMQSVSFQVGGSRFSYGGFYRGFGLYITLYLVFSAYLAWYLGDLARTAPAVVPPLGWLLAAVQGVGFVLSWLYFSTIPALFSAVIALLLAAATWLARSLPLTAIRGSHA